KIDAEHAERVIREIQPLAVFADYQAADAGQARILDHHLESSAVEAVDDVANSIRREDLAVRTDRERGQRARLVVRRQQVLVLELAGRELELEHASLAEVFLLEALEV